MPLVAIKTGQLSFPSSRIPNPNDRGGTDPTMDAIANYGPLAISVDASTWYKYESGIFTGCDYDGYGHESTLGMDYWLVRNSWSASFGEAGFIRLFKAPATDVRNIYRRIGSTASGHF